MTFKPQFLTAAMVTAMMFGSTASALTNADVKSENDRIAEQFSADKADCRDLKGNARDICMAKAKGTNSVLKAELDVRRNDTPKARYNLRIARAEAEYNVANEKCDDLAGHLKNVCVKDAKAALTAAKVDAKADMKVGDLNRSADAKIAEARQDAAADKRDANYAAAKERCDRYSGDAKDRCIADAKSRYGVK